MHDFVVGLALSTLTVLILYWEWRADRERFPNLPSSHRKF